MLTAAASTCQKKESNSSSGVRVMDRIFYIVATKHKKTEQMTTLYSIRVWRIAEKPPTAFWPHLVVHQKK